MEDRWTQGMKGFGGWGDKNIGKILEIFHIFRKSIFLESDKLMFIINIFLILRIL